MFDNTFSKQISKTLTLVLLTYPTGLPPHSSASNLPGRSQTGLSTDSLPQPKTRRRGNSRATLNSQIDTSNQNVHTGVLQKRRRKRHQGWARRYFSLDFTSSTLSYYHDRNSAALRGAIPLSLAAVAANEKSREISIDSGAEIWHLRASNEHDFGAWKQALERASSKDATKNNSLAAPELRFFAPSQSAPAEESEWTRVQSLVSQVSGSRDAIRRLARDTDPKYLTSPIPNPNVDRPGSRGRSPSPKANHRASAQEAAPSEEPKRPFWKRKTSGQSQANSKRPTAVTTNSSSSQLVVPAKDDKGKPASIISHTDNMDEIHDHLMAVLRDLDHAVSEFSTLIAESKERRQPSQPSMVPRRSMESDMSQEFFDATDGGDRSPLLTIQDSDDEGPEEDRPGSAVEEVEDDAPSDSDSVSGATATRQESGSASGLFPIKPKSLIPLPLDPIKRRATILAPTVLPPSLIGFLRKNVGKDLSTISMPVSANEPLSLLQRAAEILEYSDLLDVASQSSDPVERLMLVTAFAVSSLSANRVRERSIRKPFNPMLGETYELVREDRGFRFIAEKVSHRPVQLAYQADSKDWSLSQSPLPSQKFWGKSAEITTEGCVRITLHSTGDRFSWTPATSVLRNIIAGEKYVEPVGELCITNDSTGHRSISTFKAGGMFSGRSEEVTTRAVDRNNQELPLGLTGTWPSSLTLTRDGNPTGNTVWTAGSLVPSAPKHYGLTAFAATLNEITSIENPHLPVTDSRLRPDQRALEEGDLDLAEDLKVRLEEGQRTRRREMENAGQSWVPRWFTRAGGEADGEYAWRLKGGKDGYWEERARGSWSNVTPVFEM